MVPSGDERDAVYRDQGGSCMYCGCSLPQDGFELDHKVPIARGGAADEPENLQMLCSACSRRKGNMTGEEHRRRYRLGSSAGAQPPAWPIPQAYFGNIDQELERRESYRGIS